MPNNVYRKLLNLDLFQNSLALQFYSKFKLDMEGIKKSSYLNLKENGMSFKAKVVYTGKGRQTLRSSFA